MMEFRQVGIVPANILLPRDGIAPETWSCVACDQYTSQPGYWEQVESLVGQAPSTLRLMLPECYLDRSDELIPVIHAAMEDYRRQGILTEQVTDGFVLIERTTHAGRRLGLVCAVDLEQYDFSFDTLSHIRPTEQTVRSRLPARLKIRRRAPMELSHIMMLTDDPARTLIEPLYARRDSLRSLYDFDLMQDGGHLRGWCVDSEEDKASILNAITALRDKQGEHPLLFAVGDGNHSLATAKAYWDELKPRLTEEERACHPARYALAEIENIHDDALTFEPIHRVVTGVKLEDLMADWLAYCEARGMELTDKGEGHRVAVIQGILRKDVTVASPEGALPADTLQRYLDDFLARHSEASIDYIHGDDVVRQLTDGPDAVGFLLPALEKDKFFDILSRIGVMPRKTFSLGEANEKRFYMECRTID